MSEEKRTFSRIPVRLKGYARTMQSIDSSQIFSGDVISETSCRDELFRNSKLPEDLTNFLAEMDRKLDRVLSLMSQEHLRTEFPLDVEILELSAAGVKIRSTQPFHPDDSLELVLLLSHVPVRMASSKGRILGIDDDTGLYRFEFVDTRGSDMEAIVQFVFQQQREQIRNAKM
ncbi:PilZ domain-containing protein [uncultured Pseudodesulfovibrio sp.]|uniref:PilZ domain-containing protein n=1 Tax=uncultured Pseudodesulfovibrio sp. TaxID=2035858 RepID=UPI0029C637C6|nr:PilZ domain-containing protein [uncultured Pseudodesulfovibrio sp.]